MNSCLFFCLVGGLFGGCEVLLTVAVVGLLLGLFGGRVCLHFCSQCFTHFHTSATFELSDPKRKMGVVVNVR